MTTFAATNNRPIHVDPAGALLPRTGVIVVGRAGSIAPAVAMLKAMDDAPILAGYVVVGGAASIPVRDVGAPMLGLVEEMPVLTPRLALKAAIVCGIGEDTDSTIRTLKHLGLDVRLLPTVQDLLSPPGSAPATSRAASPSMAKAAPRIDLASLIGRTAYDMDRQAVGRVLTGKRVMITGAGGSIGSELALVAASFDPAQLVLMERSENALFEIDRLIAQRFPHIKRKAILHDIVDAEATLRACEQIRPHAVFHSAAHKHVPLMEDHPAHAVTNNLFGTKSIADAAVACGAERLVMISSDKAVNPTSVMGATKRLAEMYIHGLGNRAALEGTRLSMVRFGNVLGSAASVLTIWSQQISEGGPITITDPRMTRYFMTIGEAATLVVQSTVLQSAGTAARTEKDTGVGVYVLDMGQPVRIVDLAARYIRAHGMAARVRLETAGALGEMLRGEVALGDGGRGLTPSGPAIDVVFTGIRPGEKLHEELAYAAEQLRQTTHPGVRVWAGPGFEQDKAAQVVEMVRDMHAARYSSDRAKVIEAIRHHVPEMRDAASGLGSPLPVRHPAAG